MKVTEVFKTIFARFGNIKAGKFVDDETGESLNDVAKVLSEFNIQLYDSEGNMKNVNTILTQLSQDWSNYTQVQKNAIASAVAGVRQYENFIVLMNNFSKAQEYATIATESSGTAMEKFGAYTEGVEAKLNTFKSTFEEFSQNLLDSDLVGLFVDMGSAAISTADKLKLVQIAFIALAGVGAIKGLGMLGTKLSEMSRSAQNFVNLNGSLKTSFRGFSVSAQQAKANLLALTMQINLTGISFENMSKQQVLSTIVNANAINAFKGLTKAEIEETLASMGVAEADKAEVAAAIQNIVARQGQTISIKALTQATWLHIKAMSKEIATMVMAHPIISAIVAAIAALGYILYDTAKGHEKLAEKAEEANQAYQEEISNLENLNTELETTQNRINELNSQPSLTFVEQSELNKLRSTNSELQLQLNTQKEITKEKQRAAILAQKKKMAGYGYTAQDIIDNVDYVKEREAQGNNPIKDFFRRFLKSYNGGFSYVAGEGLQMLQDYETQISNYELIPELSPEEKAELERLKEEYQDLYLALYPEQYKKIKWEEVLGMDEFSGATKKLQDWVNAGLSEEEILQKLKEAYPNLIAKLKEFGIEEDEIIDQFKKQEQGVIGATNSLEDFKKQIESLNSTYETLNSAIEEYNSNGSISYDTWEKLIDVEDKYLSALVDENGQIKSNNQALKDLIKTKIEDATLTRIETYVNNLATAAQNGTLESTLALTEKIEWDTDARLTNVMAIIASNSALMANKEVILKTIEAMLKLSSSVNLSGDSTSKAQKATEDWEKVLDYANKLLEDKIENLEKERETIEKNIEEQIKAKEKEIELLETEKEALQDKNEEKNKEIELEELQRNLQKAQQRTMRVYYEDKGWVWEQDPEALQKAQQDLDDFYTEQKIDNIDKKIEKLEEEAEALEKTTDEEEDSYDARLKMLDEQIKKAEEYKGKWNEVKEDYEFQQNAIVAAQQLGADTKKGILNEREGVLNTFKTNYTAALEQVAIQTEKSASRINTSFASLDFDKYAAMLSLQNAGSVESSKLVALAVTGTGKDKKPRKYIGKYSNMEYVYDTASKKYYLSSSIRTQEINGKTVNVVQAGSNYFDNAYASGTKSAKFGLANVDEKGQELIVPKQGRYRMMEYGDTVVPHNLSQRLFDVASNPLRFIANALNSVKSPILSNNSQNNSSSIINIGTIELPSVTNGDSFIKQLQIISANR